MNIDTLTIARELRAADLPPEQAEAIAAAIGRAVAESSATKADVDIARGGLEAKIEQVNGGLEAKIEQVRSGLEAKIEQVRSGLDTKLEQLRTEIERARNQTVLWLISSQVALAGLILAVMKL